MSARCVACRKRIKRGQLFCADCLQKRAPSSVKKRARRRGAGLLAMLLSLPFLAVGKGLRPYVIGSRAEWNEVRSKIARNPENLSAFIRTARSMGIYPTSNHRRWVESLDYTTGTRILYQAMRSAKPDPEARGVPRRLLVLSSSLGVLVFTLSLVGLLLLVF